MSGTNTNMLGPPVLLVPTVIGEQWAYLSIPLDLAYFEAHTKDKHECCFYIDKTGSHKDLT